MPPEIHALLGASSAHRWLTCTPSAVAGSKYENTGSEYAAEGTLAHAVAEAIVGGHPESIPKEATKEMRNHAEAYKDFIFERITSENNGILLLEQKVDFSEWVPEGFGTCDCIIIQNHTLTIIDYKYGKGVQVEAENNPQMRLYALGAVNDFGIAYDFDTVEMIIFQPRLDHISTDAISVNKLLEWAENTVKPAAKKAYKGKGDYVPGEHCRFCPHAGKCRALSRMCTDFAEVHGARLKVSQIAPFEVAEILAMEPIINTWLKAVKGKALEAMLNGEEVPGFKVVEGRSNRDWVDTQMVREVLRDNGYQESDYIETKFMSPAGLEGSIGKKTVAELLGGQITKTAGNPTIAKITDKRPAYNRLDEAMKDFD